MKVAVIQPSYIPWLGFFYMMNYADLFIYFDDVQFDKNGWRNRNKILINKTEKWLTLPINKSSLAINNVSKLLNKVSLKGEAILDIASEHKRILNIHYKKSKYLYLLEEAYSKDIFSTNLLSDITIKQTEYLRELLRIDTRSERSSNINYKDEVTADIDPITRKKSEPFKSSKTVGATEYISGMAAQNYLDVDLFKKPYRCSLESIRPGHRKWLPFCITLFIDIRPTQRVRLIESI